MEREQENQRNKRAAYKVLCVIAVIVSAIALVLFLAIGPVAAYSALLGGIACLLPNLLFARFAFRYSAADSADLVMRWFYIGEAVKIIVTVLIFALTLLKLEEVNLAAMFLTYVVALVMNIHGLALVMGREHNEQ